MGLCRIKNAHCTGRRSIALWVRFLGGGVKPNNPKIGITVTTYKGYCCKADMHFRVAKKETAPQRSSALGRYSLLQVKGTIAALT